MITKRFSLFVVIAILVITGMLLVACGTTPAKVCGDRPVDSYNKETGEVQCARIEVPEASAQINTPAAQANESTADVATYKVEKNHAWVYASDGSLLAEVTAPQGVDLPSEWLKDREGVYYLFQSGIDRKVELTVTLYKGAAFAIDGDWMLYGGTNLGIVDNSADYRAFADGAGTYHFTASSFGLAVGPFRSESDKAGFVLADRRNADGNDGRPEYWLDATGKTVQIGQ